MSKKYNVNYFIKKFKAIPDREWTTGKLVNDDGTKFCALGHCGFRQGNPLTKEGWELNRLFNIYFNKFVPEINDGIESEFERYKRPKTRILKALETIKKVQG